jgi:tungstate transport system substrate-binding protein
MSKTFLSHTSKLLLLFIFLMITPVSANSTNTNKLIKLATTTSTENSGLLKYLLPEFEKDTGYKIHTISAGTGKALRMGRDGDVDVLLVHAKGAEDKFMADGYGEKRLGVMYNDFVIVGPKIDPANLTSSKSAAEAMNRISSTKNIFLSRGDDSGTHKKELKLWKTANVDVKANGGKWYREAGQGMGKVLQMAGEMDAYTLTDRGTWLAYKSKSPLKITFEGDSILFNPYGIIAVSSKKYPDINSAGAHALMDWITSKKGQLLIGQFKVAGKVLFTPNVASIAKADVKEK